MNQPWLIKSQKKLLLLNNELDYIFKNFGSNFSSTGKKFLIKVAKDEKRLTIIICLLK